MCETVFIYALCDPDTSEVRYIGVTTNPIRRLLAHVSDRKQPRGKARAEWIADLRARRLPPSIHILEEVPTEQGSEAEKRWIAHYLAQGACLTNKAFNTTRKTPAHKKGGASTCRLDISPPARPATMRASRAKR